MGATTACDDEISAVGGRGLRSRGDEMDQNIVAFILGVVEGLTEFLPVSSTGHMIIVGDFLKFEGERASVFEVFIQLGAILSVFLVYREKFMTMLQRKNWARQDGLSLYTSLPACCRPWLLALSAIPLSRITCSRRARLSLA